jgi:hypothetical protein
MISYVVYGGKGGEERGLLAIDQSVYNHRPL